MATRYIGNARVTLRYDGYRSPHLQYSGMVSVPVSPSKFVYWKFDTLGISEYAHPGSADAPDAYDSAAAAAVAFGSYYTTHNRGDDVPAWAPSAEIADAIDDAVGWATDEEGRGLYAVRRTKNGPPHWTS